MRPFSHSEKNTISELLEDMGFRKDITPDNNERYTIINDCIIALTIKTPISIGVKLNIPFEVAAFYNTFFFQPRIINSQTLEMINFLAINLQNIANKLVIEHTFPIDEKKRDLLNLLNDFMPEYFSGDTDRQWLTRIRIALMNKHKLFQDIEIQLFDDVAKGLVASGLEPTFDLPVSLKSGIPKSKKNAVLFFGNSEEKEFFIEEKGFITFLRDVEQNNIFARTYFDSYSPLILEKVFGDVENFSVKNLILSWIRFCRMTLNPLVNVINSEYILSREFYPINLDTLFNSKANFSDVAMPIPFLAREKMNKEKLHIPSGNLFSKPPLSFNELNATAKYNASLSFIKTGKIPSAIAVLREALVMFTRYQQKVGVIRVLTKLSEIASDLKKYDQAISYLNNGLEACKSGQATIELIIGIHEKMGKIYTKQGKLGKALEHYQIINKFLKAQDPKKYKRAIQIMRIKIAKILVEMERYKDANLIFKEIPKDGSKYPEVMALYYLERARYYLKKNSLSNATQMLKKGALVEKADKKTIAMIHFELGKIYLYERKIGSRAQAHLLLVDKMLGDEKTDDLLIKLTTYEMLSDAFNKTRDREEMKYYMDRSQQVRKLLQLRGVY